MSTRSTVLVLFLCVLLATIAAVAVAASAKADTIHLRSGETLIGDARLEGTDAVIVESRYPEVRTVRLTRDDLAPESLYGLVERTTDAHSVAGVRSLADLAERLGLNAVAIADYRAVKALEPSSASTADARIVALTNEIASDVLEDGRSLLAQGQAAAALQYLHTVLERYPDSPAAKEAKPLVEKATAIAGESAQVARVTVSAPDAPRLADEVEKHLAKGDAAVRLVSGHAGMNSVQDQREMLRAIDHFEDAWESAKRLPVSATGDGALDQRLTTLRSRSQTSLLRAYLTAGSIFLQRRAIPTAERFCNKACELDPQGQSSHDLHRQIIAAKTTYSRGVRLAAH